MKAFQEDADVDLNAESGLRMRVFSSQLFSNFIVSEFEEDADVVTDVDVAHKPYLHLTHIIRPASYADCHGPLLCRLSWLLAK